MSTLWAFWQFFKTDAFWAFGNVSNKMHYNCNGNNSKQRQYGIFWGKKHYIQFGTEQYIIIKIYWHFVRGLDILEIFHNKGIMGILAIF